MSSGVLEQQAVLHMPVRPSRRAKLENSRPVEKEFDVNRMNLLPDDFFGVVNEDSITRTSHTNPIYCTMQYVLEFGTNWMNKCNPCASIEFLSQILQEHTIYFMTLIQTTL